MKRTRTVVSIVYILLGLAVCLLAYSWLTSPEFLPANASGLWGPLYFLLMLGFFVGLVLIVGGTTHDKTPLKRTFERLIMRFKQKTHG